jgi:hypothetical protein
MYHLAFLLPGAGAGARTALAAGRICPRDLDPRDLSPLYHTVMSISSSVGNPLSSLVHVAWSEHMGA